MTTMATTKTTAAQPDPAPAGDTAPPDPLAPVGLLTRMVKAGIRLIPDPPTRQRCWSVYLHLLEAAQLRDDSRMPWEQADQVTSLPRHVAQDIAVDVIREVPDYGTRERMVTVMTKIGDDHDTAQARSPASTKPGKYPPQQCARPGCGVTFVPQRPNAKYHSANCRQAAYEARKKARADDAHSR
jgi:hypothetical protein